MDEISEWLCVYVFLAFDLSGFDVRRPTRKPHRNHAYTHSAPITQTYSGDPDTENITFRLCRRGSHWSLNGVSGTRSSHCQESMLVGHTVYCTSTGLPDSWTPLTYRTVMIIVMIGGLKKYRRAHQLPAQSYRNESRTNFDTHTNARKYFVATRANFVENRPAQLTLGLSGERQRRMWLIRASRADLCIL